MAKKKITVEYSIEKAVTAELESIMTSNPKFLRLKDNLVVAACCVMRMDQDETTQPGKGQRVTLKKVPPEMQALMSSRANFVLVIDYHWWHHANPRQRRGNVSKQLYRIRLEEGEKGIFKIGLNKWDVQEMYSNLESEGVYDDETQHLHEVASTMTSTERILSAAAGGIRLANKEKEQVREQQEKEQPAKGKAKENKAEPELEAEPVDEEKPRVVARSLPPKNANASRPARKIPPEPAAQAAPEFD